MKIAICKTFSCGAPLLVLGINIHGNWWQKYQMYSCENYYKEAETLRQPLPEGTPVEPWSLTQKQREETADNLLKLAEKQKPYQGTEVKFDCLSEPVKIYNDGKHDFSLLNAEAVEVEDIETFLKEITKARWEAFDDESWAK